MDALRRSLGSGRKKQNTQAQTKRHQASAPPRGLGAVSPMPLLSFSLQWADASRGFASIGLYVAPNAKHSGTKIWFKRLIGAFSRPP
jgi:hypothetical protein